MVTHPEPGLDGGAPPAECERTTFTGIECDTETYTWGIGLPLHFYLGIIMHIHNAHTCRWKILSNHKCHVVADVCHVVCPEHINLFLSFCLKHTGSRPLPQGSQGC